MFSLYGAIDSYKGRLGLYGCPVNKGATGVTQPYLVSQG